MSKAVVLGVSVGIAGILAIGAWWMYASLFTIPTHPPIPSIPSDSTSPRDLSNNHNLGLNFFIFDGAAKPGHNNARAITPTATETDLAALHATAFRQFTNGDVMWNTIEPKEGAWNWTKTDEALATIAKTAEPIATLFAMQYASPNAPWKTAGTFEKIMTPEAEAYLRAVVGRYKGIVTYWEIGNEMDHWRAADPDEMLKHQGKPMGATEKMPTLLPTDGYDPEDQGKFFAAAAAIIREEDSDAVLVMPGISGSNTYNTETWLPGFVQGAGTDGFDVVNYHDYPSWDGMQSRFDLLKAATETLGISEKPIWLTETGSTADESLSQRTNYPNSTTTQAADVIRRLLVAFSNDVRLVLWHTYFSSPSENSMNDWRAYGLRDENGDNHASYEAYRALAESFPATSVTNVSTVDGMYVMDIQSIDGPSAFAVWGTGSWTLPGKLTTQYTITPTGLSKATAPAEGTEIVLSAIPQLFR